MIVKPPVEDGAVQRWTKSSYSGSDNNDCVEVAAAPTTVHVRDSKDRQGPQLAVTPAAWVGFVSHVSRPSGTGQ